MVAGLVAKALLLLQLGSGVVAAQNASRPLYKNPHAPVEARVSDLLSRMTIEDKMSQLMQGDVGNWMDSTTGAFNYTGLVENMEMKAGAFYVGYAVPWDWLATNIKRAQDYLLQNTTLGIPALVQTEGIHGFLLENATIYNSPIAYACSFNRELIEKMGRLIAQEARAIGTTQLFAPLADLARELRYGRVEETFSEDSYLAGEMAYHYIVGLQSLNVSATVKHFVGYSLPEQGLNTAPVQGGERYLRSTWLPSFKRAIVDAGAWSIMSAYHAYDGIPAVADWFTLTKILRQEWNYDYYVISDSGATDRLCTAFKLCRSSPIDMEAVTTQALPAGNDVEMGGGSFNYQKIPELVESGQLDIEVVNTAVSRVLRAKFEMGLFENPYPAAPRSEWNKLIHSPEAVELARTIDKESIVLLENHNETLPLKKSGNIAVIGPMAHGFMNYGDYVIYGSQWRGVTPLDGIKAAVGDAATVNYAQGCERWSNDQSGFDEAIAAAKKSDVAIVVVGTWSRDQTELWENYNATTGEHVDLDSLALVGAQGPLIQAIRDTGVPTIVVLSSGKPITDVTWIANSTSALVQQFYPSEQGGNALADVLFGDYNPSGKLSVSFPHYVGDLPIYYDYLNSARNIGDAGRAYPNGTLEFGHQYVLGDPHAVYPFGYGKSYSTFEYSDIKVSKTNVSASDTVTVSLEVKNLDESREATEVVQVYVVDEIASVVVPNRLLKGFEKVVIPAGGSKSVSIDIKVEDLGLWNNKMEYVVEKGEFGVLVGSSSVDIRGRVAFWVV
ncbi:CAZyme family GH3 [Aspergillus niger]|uniref:beta-glucosidase n=1 Tax=Aspergillus niger TaxID=5061 RepID=A0A3F3RL20_ASPNG|nr:CAZyme family GH3 [Aspergillus niger]KAI2953646.1 CAZyme family GH3 [Aspergillus niger]KAI2960703.1 CAZyme family GH3 [Aspergillus niger]KAI3031831.1 CAZyme family GH3 [Aspergillus niger]TPR10733.1 RNA recognition motif family protein [Aspergillus niger]